MSTVLKVYEYHHNIGAEQRILDEHDEQLRRSLVASEE
jgi:hypothetical protein